MKPSSLLIQPVSHKWRPILSIVGTNIDFKYYNLFISGNAGDFNKENNMSYGFYLINYGTIKLTESSV